MSRQCQVNLVVLVIISVMLVGILSGCCSETNLSAGDSVRESESGHLYITVDLSEIKAEGIVLDKIEITVSNEDESKSIEINEFEIDEEIGAEFILNTGKREIEVIGLNEEGIEVANGNEIVESGERPSSVEIPLKVLPGYK